jgi:hypothetical protein
LTITRTISVYAQNHELWAHHGLPLCGACAIRLFKAR